MSQQSQGAETTPPTPNYAKAQHGPSRMSWLLALLGMLYLLGYAGMWALGRIRPFYNQGGFEMEYDDRVAIPFLPLMEAEQAWHNAFSDPPVGG